MARSVIGVTAVALIWVIGCASVDVDPETAPAALAMAPSCCTSIGEVPTVRLEDVHNRVVALDSPRPVIALPSGKSYVLAIELPENRAWTALTINSYYTGTYIPSARIAYPSVAILDADRKLVRSVPDSSFTFVKSTWTEPERLAATIELSTEPGRERYLVIYTTEQSVVSRRKYVREGSMGFMVGAVPVIVPTKDSVSTPGSPVGSIKITTAAR